MPRKPQPPDPRRGRRVALLREQHRLSQEQLAHEVGVSARTLQNWEAGGAITKPDRLAELLDTTVSYLLTGDAVPGPRDGEPAELLDRLSRQQEILRRVASNRLLTAEQLEYLEKALDVLEHGRHRGGAAQGASREEVA